MWFGTRLASQAYLRAHVTLRPTINMGTEHVPLNMIHGSVAYRHVRSGRKPIRGCLQALGTCPTPAPLSVCRPQMGGLTLRPPGTEASAVTYAAPPKGAAPGRRDVGASRRGVARGERRARGGLCRRHRQRPA